MKKIIISAFTALWIFMGCDSGTKGNKNIIAADADLHSSTSEELSGQANKHLQKTLQWEAFKTPEKVAVKGTFTDIALTHINKEGKTWEEILSGSQFTCNPRSVSTHDVSRDQKLVEFFFNQMQETTISGSFGDLKNGILPTTIKMNGKQITKDFSYASTKDTITLTGSIDIIDDFGAQRAFSQLHEACRDLHQGKTWSDVTINVTISR